MLLDFLFPPKCLYCKKYGKYICDDCYNKLDNKYVFKETYGENFDYIIFNSFYAGKVKSLLHNFKFHEKSYLYKYFIEVSLKNERISKFLKQFDYITFIPMSSKKKAIRGYNQAELLAKELGKKLQVKVIDALEKENNVKVQSSLSELQREENAKYAFKFKKSVNIENKNIILVDDILTTGATVKFASKILKQHKANQICVFVVAKTKLRRMG